MQSPTMAPTPHGIGIGWDTWPSVVAPTTDLIPISTPGLRVWAAALVGLPSLLYGNRYVKHLGQLMGGFVRSTTSANLPIDVCQNKVASGDEEASGHDLVPEHRLGGQSSVLCPDGLPVYREILRPYNGVIQSVHNLHVYRSIYSNSERTHVYKEGFLLLLSVLLSRSCYLLHIFVIFSTNQYPSSPLFLPFTAFARVPLARLGTMFGIHLFHDLSLLTHPPGR